MLTHLARAQAHGSIRKEKTSPCINTRAWGVDSDSISGHETDPGTSQSSNFHETNHFLTEVMSQGFSGERTL
jgi:hypothetical protein